MLAADDRYGNADRVDVADLLEVRCRRAPPRLQLLVRTTTMRAAGDTAVVVLVDTTPGDDRAQRPVRHRPHHDDRRRRHPPQRRPQRGRGPRHRRPHADHRRRRPDRLPERHRSDDPGRACSDGPSRWGAGPAARSPWPPARATPPPARSPTSRPRRQRRQRRLPRTSPSPPGSSSARRWRCTAGSIDEFLIDVAPAALARRRQRGVGARPRLPRPDLHVVRGDLDRERHRGHPPALRRLPPRGVRPRPAPRR